MINKGKTFQGIGIDKDIWKGLQLLINNAKNCQIFLKENLNVLCSRENPNEGNIDEIGEYLS